MKTTTFTQSDLLGFVGEQVEVSVLLGNTYEGEVIDVTEQTLTLSYYSIVKDQQRELDIDLSKIEWVKESL
jgi:hypothetical protein